MPREQGESISFVMVFDMNERLNFLKWALCDLIVDLTINTEVFRDAVQRTGFDPNLPKDQALMRMVCSALVVNLSKLSEALGYLGKDINFLEEPLRSQCISVKQEIESRKIYQFRNKYAAHLLDNKTKLPLSLMEGERRLTAIFGSTIGELNDFCDWVCPPAGEANKNSVTSVLCDLRDYCRQKGGNGPRP